MTQFSSLGLSNTFLETIASQGYDTPTPIQAQAIPPVLDGRDLLGCAQTGTGKTAAFSLPMLQRLIDGRRGRPAHRRPRALVLSPTRELAGQIEESLRVYGRRTGLRHAVIYGGVKQFRQVRQLQAGVDVIVATPGRLMDLMEQGYVDLGAVEIFVLDEADRMLDMGFIQPIRKISESIPAERQTLLFSATMPRNIVALADSLLRDPVRITVEPDRASAAGIEQVLYMAPGEKKQALLAHLLEDAGVARAVVFTRTKYGAENLAKRLVREGVQADAIHGNKSQSQRQRALDGFRAGRTRVLVATDVAARGLDVDGITHVFNFNLPNEPEAYVHRIGRTGRAGATGTAVSFCSPDERGFLRAIERLTGEQMDATALPKNLGSGEARQSEAADQRDSNQAGSGSAARPAKRRGRSRSASENRPNASSRGKKPGGSARRGGPRRARTS